MASKVFAVTDFVVTVNKTGEDYNTLALAEDALDNAGDITNANCKVFAGSLTRGTIADGTAITQTTSGATGVCIHHTATQMLIDTIVGTPNGTNTWYPTVDGNDTTNAWTPTDTGAAANLRIDVYNDDGTLTGDTIFDGLTCASGQSWYINIPDGERHTGIAGTGVVSSGYMQLKDSFYIIDGIEISGFTGVAGISVTTGGSSGTIKNCIVHDGVGYEGVATTLSATVINTVSYDNGNASEEGFKVTGGTVYLYNCVAHSNDDGISVGALATVYCYNSASFDNDDYTGGLDFSGDFAGGSNNASQDSTADDDADMASGALVNLTASDEFTSVTNGSEDFHLKSTSNLIGAGVDNPSSGLYLDDFEGETRTSTWDMGADEYVVVGGVSIFQPIINIF